MKTLYLGLFLVVPAAHLKASPRRVQLLSTRPNFAASTKAEKPKILSSTNTARKSGNLSSTKESAPIRVAQTSTKEVTPAGDSASSTNDSTTNAPASSTNDAQAPAPATPVPAPPIPAATTAPTPNPTPNGTIDDRSIPPVNSGEQAPPSEIVTDLPDPNRVEPLAPLLAPPAPATTPATNTTPIPNASTNAPATTSAPAPTTPVPDVPVPNVPVPDAPPLPGDVSGVEPPGGNFSLSVDDESKDIIYDMERGLAYAESPVTFRYREFIVRGQRGLVDYNTNTATLSGNLTVLVPATPQSAARTFTGNVLSFNLDTGAWRLSQVATTFAPEFFPQGTVLEPIYLRDGVVQGQAEEARGENFKFSSCDRDHYYLRSNRLEFYRTPGGEPAKIVLRQNALFLLGRRIVPLPVYVISLLGQRSRRQPLQTTAGQNAIDGFFVRTLYDLRANENRSDSILADVLQKRGIGLGIQREFLAGGLFYLYALSGQNGGREINARVDKSYRLARGTDVAIRYDATQNNSLTGEGVSNSNANFNFTRRGARAQSAALLTLNSSSFGSGDNTARSLSLEHRQDFGAGYTLDARGLFNTSSSGFGAGSQAQTLDSNLNLRKTSRLFDAYLRTELHNDLENSRTYQLERLPELTLQTNSDRLNLPFLKRLAPGDLTLSLGQFNEPRGADDVESQSRANFSFNARPRLIRLLGQGRSSSILGFSGAFEQAFYGDDTARYNTGMAFNLANTLGAARFLVNYTKQKPVGFTPFQFDLQTANEYLDYSLSYQQGQRVRFNLTGGRDLQNGFTRDIIANLQFAPSDAFYGSLGASFAPEGSRFGDIYGNFRLNLPRKVFAGGTYNLGFRYAPEGANQGLTRANASVDIQLGRNNRLQGLVGYDGFANKFDFTQLRFTRDLHCFNLYATYDSRRNEVRLDLALKAFPFLDTRFGRNENSEGFDTTVGGIR